MRIKPRFLVSAFFLLIAGAASAQVEGHFGVKAGASSAKTGQVGTSSFISRYRTTFHLGGMYRLRVNRFVVQPELLFSNKGGSFKGTVNQLGGARTEVIRNNYNYLSAPLLLGWIPTEGLTLQVGPEFSYALNTPRTNGPARRQDLGVVVGVHYDFLDVLDKFSLHIRYIHGLQNISDNPIVERYNRTFQVSMVYNFYRKK